MVERKIRRHSSNSGQQILNFLPATSLFLFSRQPPVHDMAESTQQNISSPCSSVVPTVPQQQPPQGSLTVGMSVQHHVDPYLIIEQYRQQIDMLTREKRLLESEKQASQVARAKLEKKYIATLEEKTHKIDKLGGKIKELKREMNKMKIELSKLEEIESTHARLVDERRRLLCGSVAYVYIQSASTLFFPILIAYSPHNLMCSTTKLNLSFAIVD